MKVVTLLFIVLILIVVIVFAGLNYRQLYTMWAIKR